MVANLDLAEIKGLSLQPVRFVALSDDSAAFLFACAAFYQSRFNWLVEGEAPNDEEWNEIQRLIGKTEHALMNPLVGLIFPHALGAIAGLPLLPCNGAVYNRSDYPILYEKLDAVYIIDEDTFRVPDMRDRFVVGEGLDRSIDDSGGEAEHVLTDGEMPIHSHTNSPHAHSEIIASPTIGAAITGVPVPSAIPAVGSTGFASVVIDSAGGGAAHNNMPPFVTCRWAIVAG